jgi:hypothetical protein
MGFVCRWCIDLSRSWIGLVSNVFCPIDMNRYKREIYLILLGVVVLVLSLLVLIQNKSLTDELLGTVGLVCGMAILVVSLPTNGGKDDKAS